MLDLQKMRNDIDEIDTRIVKLFEERMKICENVAQFKIETGKPVFDKSREQEKLDSLGGKATMTLTAAACRNCSSRSCPSAANASTSFFRKTAWKKNQTLSK